MLTESVVGYIEIQRLLYSDTKTTKKKRPRATKILATEAVK
jgi:hypothetical protein